MLPPQRRTSSRSPPDLHYVLAGSHSSLLKLPEPTDSVQLGLPPCGSTGGGSSPTPPPVIVPVVSVAWLLAATAANVSVARLLQRCTEVRHVVGGPGARPLVFRVMPKQRGAGGGPRATGASK